MAKALTTTFAGTGKEPTWSDFNEKNRQNDILRAFNFYSYHHDYKAASDYIADYLSKAGDRDVEYKKWKKVPARSVPNAIGWYARMITRGYPATELELTKVEDAIAYAFTLTPVKAASVESTEENAKKKANVQEIMRERANELGGELEFLLDTFIADGARAKHSIRPINEMKLANILPQHVPTLVEHWENVKAEFNLAHKGVQKDLNEGYSHFTKLQLRNLIKFADLVIADLNSYVTFKKASRATPKRRVKTPEQQVSKLKFQRECKTLKVKSVKPAKIIGAKEMFVYSTKKRKLHYYVADESAGNALMVKNNTIVGFDPNKTVMKTIRTPDKQVPELMKASKPQSRKYFQNIKAVEAKLSGRFADDLIILKIW